LDIILGRKLMLKSSPERCEFGAWTLRGGEAGGEDGAVVGVDRARQVKGRSSHDLSAAQPACRRAASKRKAGCFGRDDP